MRYIPYSANYFHSCLTLCDPTDYSPPGSSVHGILQARILEWIAILVLQGVFLIQGLNLCLLYLLHWRAGSSSLVPPGKPIFHTGIDLPVYIPYKR